MAGHFLLRNISQMNLQCACSNGQARLTEVTHAGVPMSVTGSMLIGQVLRQESIPSREHLPRHIYLQFSHTHPAYDQQRQYIQSGAAWVDYLQKPTDRGFRAKALCRAAEDAWARGDKRGAVLAQMEHGSVSIEIYFVDGVGV